MMEMLQVFLAIFGAIFGLSFALMAIQQIAFTFETWVEDDMHLNLMRTGYGILLAAIASFFLTTSVGAVIAAVIA